MLGKFRVLNLVLASLATVPDDRPGCARNGGRWWSTQEYQLMEPIGGGGRRERALLDVGIYDRNRQAGRRFPADY